ncbi:hypothetical protein [Cytophaga hutchinsonii]|nr:hypothetical protein [Cytophaga hutchinsonii]
MSWNRKDNCKNIFYIVLPVIVHLFSLTLLMAQPAAGWSHKKELYTCLQHPGDSIYIHDRAALQELHGSTCIKTEARYHSVTKQGELIQIAIKTKPFVASVHQLKLTDTSYVAAHGKKKADSIRIINKIDDTYAYGIHGNKPQTELSTFVILRNNKMLQFPKQFYTDFYNAVLCEHERTTEAYITLNEEYLYIYMHGGDKESSYTVKFIFDRTHYITRIVNTHPCLRDFDFIDGFGECE